MFTTLRPKTAGAITRKYFIPIVGRIEFRNLGGKYTFFYMDKKKYKRTKKKYFCFVGVIPFHGFSMYGKYDSYKLLKPQDCFLSYCSLKLYVLLCNF